MDAASSEIERLKRKIELMEAELAAYRRMFADIYQRNNSGHPAKSSSCLRADDVVP
jgi:hypothetical protein